MVEKVKGLADKYWRSCVDIRRHLHRNPELSFCEKNTALFLESELKQLGLDDLQRVDENGLLATIHGNNEGTTIMLRADIDALPIREENTHNYISNNPGVMHACGHDAHSAMLITAGRILADLQASWNGTVKLLFQPAEEKIPGGAPLMIKGGVLKDPCPQYAIGQHVKPELKTGQVGLKSGKFMASADDLVIKFIGKGGHAAMPELCIDPILMAAQFLVSVQQLVSRNASPKIPSVLSFGKIHGNGATNIIPDAVTIEGTLRTLDEAWRKKALGLIEHQAQCVAKSMGGSCEVDISHGYPYLHNNELLSTRIKTGLAEYVSTENVIDEEIWMAAEDFAYYSHEVPSCFYLLGVKNDTKKTNGALHTPTFDIDEDAMKIGSGLMAYLAIRELENG